MSIKIILDMRDWREMKNKTRKMSHKQRKTKKKGKINKAKITKIPQH